MKTILLIDDHADIRRLMRVTMGNTYQVLEAGDGVSGLEIIRREKPDVVVLDVMMPGELDGLQVLDAVKSDALLRRTHVILVTARGQARDYEDGLQRGAAAYLIKPFSPLQLINIIREVLAK